MSYQISKVQSTALDGNSIPPNQPKKRIKNRKDVDNRNAALSTDSLSSMIGTVVTLNGKEWGEVIHVYMRYSRGGTPLYMVQWVCVDQTYDHDGSYRLTWSGDKLSLFSVKDSDS